MDWLAKARIDTRRELTRQGFGSLYARIHQLLLDHNPVGFDLTKGPVRDDYGLPVGTLIPKLQTATQEDLPLALHREMEHWYRDAAGRPEAYRAIAHEIWQAWVEFQRDSN